MPASQQRITPAWSVRLAFELTANDQTATSLTSGLTEQQLNWQTAPGFWSIGQCLEHLCVTNEAYLPRLSDAIADQPDAPVEQITPGWLSRWFLRTFVEPSPNSRRIPAPAKIRPASHVDRAVLERFLTDNRSCREFILRARGKNINQIRFRNPLIRGLRFTIGTGLEIVVSHERRHLLQAERVRDSANFPRS
jgi:DinB superfamily